MEVVERFMWSYFEDMDALNVLRADINPRPSGHITEQIELVRRLIERGHAYEVNGNVYFSVSSFDGYGKLSRRKVDEQMEGARVSVNPEKRDPADFAVWIKANAEHILKWPSPWSEGYPGWHLECSAMAMKYLGETIDIHGGGLENMFPHNESEVAQAEAATGHPFVRYWLLNNMVTVGGTKMGKSLGNYTTIKDALQRHDPMALRFFILTTHYRSNTDFSEEAIAAAAKGLDRIWNVIDELDQRLPEAPEGPMGEEAGAIVAHARRQFLEAMDADFNTPSALAVLFDCCAEINRRLHSPESRTSRSDLEAWRALFRETFEEILGLRPRAARASADTDHLPKLVELLIELRQQARQARNWTLSDQIRDRLDAAGIELKDGKEGTTWSFKVLDRRLP